MRIMFFYNIGEDVGSAQTVHNYSQAAAALGHEVALYGHPRPNSPLTYSLDVSCADVVVFILESYLEPYYAGGMNLVRLLSQVPRSKRLVIDNDGLYNHRIEIHADFSHTDEADCRRRNAFYESISDRIYQPSYHPLRPSVGTFIFHGYNPSLEVPIDFRGKEYGMFYVGNNWFRWRAMQRVLGAVEKVRPEVGRIGIAGWSWSAMPHWVASPLREQACYTDPEYLKSLGVEVMPPVPVNQVIPTMSKGVFSPVLVRPLFNHLHMVNPRIFETPAANTIPLFDLDPEYVEEIFGEPGLEFVLPVDKPEDKILDTLRHPERYVPLIEAVRKRLRERHSYEVRFKELMEIVQV